MGMINHGRKTVWLRIGLALLLVLGFALPADAQSTAQDMEQLVLDIGKLVQLKAMLSDLKAGYTILTQGYGTVKSMTEGNFNLHAGFLNSLQAVSPEVRRYGGIAAILAEQAEIASAGKKALARFRSCGCFSPGELLYMNHVLAQLLSRSADNATVLLDVLTAGRLRMDDAGRLSAIDRIYADTRNQMDCLRHFTDEAELLAVQREKEKKDLRMMRSLFGARGE